MNTFGRNFRVTTFGESHGPALGAVIDGLPAGLAVEVADIQRELDRRRPGASPYASQRREPDAVEILSGLADGQTNGAPLALLIRNHDARSADYHGEFRPGQADWPYFIKYGLAPQPGGGRASGRETAARVAAGAVARLLLKPLGIKVESATSAVGRVNAESLDFDFSENDPLRFADPARAEEARLAVEEAIGENDSLGSVVTIRVTKIPAGWGEPVFGKLEALLGAAFFSIGAVRAVEFGEGLKLAETRGSEANDPLGPQGPASNRHGGIMGGLSTGLPVTARLFIKPTPSIGRAQAGLDAQGRPAAIKIHGRHDPVLAPRLGPVAEAMALCVLADLRLEPGRRI